MSERTAVRDGLKDLQAEVDELKRQFKDWIEWPGDLEVDDRIAVSLLRCHKLLSDLAMTLAGRDRG